MKNNITEQVLRESEEKYRTLVENFPNGAVGLFDQNLRYTAVGGELVSAVGVDPEDRIGSKITDIYPEEIVKEVEPHFRATFEGVTTSFEAEYHDRKLLAQTLPIKNDKGEVASGMLVVQDITERWKARQALRRSEEKYRTLFETMEEGFCIIKLELDANDEVAEFRFEEINPSFKKHTGLKDVEGKKGSEVLENRKTEWVNKYAQALLTGESQHFEAYSEHLEQWFEVSAFPVGDPEEQKVAGLFNNITKRKQAQEKLKTMNQTLEKQVKERTKSLVSYQNQLRSLVAELGKTEEQERQRLASDLHDNLGQMLVLGKMKVAQVQQESLPDGVAENLNELEELIEDAVTYTRELTSDLKPPASLDEKDLKAHIHWVAEKMKKHDLEVIIEDDDRPKPLDKEVRLTLLQCLKELLFNVVKHASVMEAIVVMKRLEGIVQVTVKDEGKGFDPEHQGLIPDQEGGFGLFSIRERIDMLGGRININSDPGKGTEVSLYVPLKETYIESPRHESTQRHEKSEMIKILLVDNPHMMREGLRSVIEKENDMTVIGEADDGKEAEKLASSLSPDIILMEVNLRNMNGIEATKRILAEDPEIRIIGFSAEDDKRVTQYMRKAGASSFISKKEAFKTLVSTIRAEASAQQ